MKDMKTVYGSLVTGDWPATVAKNASGAAAVDGTPFCAELIDDLWGWQKRIMNLAGLAPDGVSDDYDDSQIVTAIRRAGRNPGDFVFSGMNAAALALNRLLALTGQCIAIASYSELCAAVYCGDSLNASADCFYKTSDAGGATRSTSGAYMVMPDARGLVPRGLGSNNKIKPVNTLTYSYNGGDATTRYLTDAMMGHRHNRNTDGLLERAITGSGVYTVYSGGYGVATYTTTGDPVSDGTYGSPRTSFENRTASLGMQICIAY